MSELFAIPEQRSPRLRWLDRHGVVLHKRFDRGDWEAYQPDTSRPDYGAVTGTGPQPDDALADWARKAGARLWNEEAQP